MVGNQHESAITTLLTLKKNKIKRKEKKKILEIPQIQKERFDKLIERYD